MGWWLDEAPGSSSLFLSERPELLIMIVASETGGLCLKTTRVAPRARASSNNNQHSSSFGSFSSEDS